MGANISCVAEKRRKDTAEEDENDEKTESRSTDVSVGADIGKTHELQDFIPSSNQMKNINTQLRFIKLLGKGASGHVVLATHQNYFEPDLSIVYGDTCDNGDITNNANVNYIETPRLPAAIDSVNSNHSSSSSSNNSNGTRASSGSFHFLDKRDNERFALKIISKKQKSNEQLFYNEISLLNKLSNCNSIAHFITCYMDDENYYIATEYCTGGALLDVIYKCQYFTEQQASYYIKSILNTIEYMHSLNIIHGDLKPGNIVFDKIPIFNEHFDGKSTSKLFVNDAKLIIIDFGEALEIENESKEYEHFSGTLVYLPPELCDFEPRNGFDLKMGDMWTIGIISYILLVGKLPFCGENKEATLQEISTLNVPWPTYDNKNNGNNGNNEACDISKRGKDFVNNLLNKFAIKRMTASNALKHDWIVDNEHNPRQTLKIVEFANKELFDNIGNFKDAPPLEKILVNHAIAELTNEDRQWLKVQFRKIDRKKLGLVDTDDIRYFLLKTDESLTKDEANMKAARLMNMMDPSNTGKITLKDFVRAKTLSLLHTHLGSNEEIQLKGFERLSKLLDKDNTGKIDSKLLEAELAQSLTNAEKTAFMTQVCDLQASTEFIATIKPIYGSSDANDNNNNNKNTTPSNTKVKENESGTMIDLELVEYLGCVSAVDMENESDFEYESAYESEPSVHYGSIEASDLAMKNSNNDNKSSINNGSDEIEIKYESQAATVNSKQCNTVAQNKMNK